MAKQVAAYNFEASYWYILASCAAYGSQVRYLREFLKNLKLDNIYNKSIG